MKASWQVTKVMGIGRNQQVCSVEVNSECGARCKGQDARCKGQDIRCKGQGQHQR